MSQKETPLKVAYLLDRFPAISETFILNEIIELRRHGLDIPIFALSRPNEGVIHKKAEELAKETCYFSNLGHLSKFKKIFFYLYVHFYFLITNPLKYLNTLWFAYKIGRYRYILSEFKLAAYCALLLKNSAAGHIHAHFADTASEYAMLASMLSGIPYSFTIHAHDIFVRKGKWARMSEYLGEKINFAEFVISKTEYNRRFIKEKYPGINEGKLRLIHYGINLDGFSPSKSCRKEARKFVILSVARLVEIKGHRYLLEACNLLTKKGISDFTCKIVGDGPLREDLEKLTQDLNLTDLVQFAGPLPSDKVILSLQESDVFVLPCVVDKFGDMDGMPNVLIEAMAMEKPVISTYVSGVPELIKDGAGRLLPPGDSKALAEAIEEIYLMDLEARKRMGQKGREIVEREFNMGKESEKIKDIFVDSIQKTDN